LVLFLIVQQLGAVYAVRYYAFARQAQALAVDAVRAGCDEPLFVKLVCPTDPQLVPLYRPTLEAKQLSIFGRPLENRNELSDTFCCKGDAHMANRNLDSAEAFYRAALLLNPGNTVPLTGLALVQFDRKDWPAAEQALVHCLQVHPDDSDLHSTLGVTLAQEKKFDDAFAEFAKARQLAPTSPVSYINEAAVRADLSQFSKAIALYQEALRRDPTNAAAQLALGRLLARTGVAN
jgi:tetratricopeptide (TPR) repeat protein